MLYNTLEMSYVGLSNIIFNFNLIFLQELKYTESHC